MKKDTKKALLILAVLIIIYFAIVAYSILMPNYPFTCPNGQVRGKECTGPVAGSKYVCYEPMNDAGKECNSASDCKGACVVESLTNCRQITEPPFLAICDSTVKGKCSSAKRYDSTNNLFDYSDIPDYFLSKLNEYDYSLTQENKIIVKEEVLCA